MPTEIVYIAQKRDTRTGEVSDTEEIYRKDLLEPTSFDEFGLRHRDQIAIIKASQDYYLKLQAQEHLEKRLCPNCHKQAAKKGKFTSDFHDVLTDHKVTLSRFICRCGWKNNFTVKGLFGKATHPELVKLQTTLASNNSFSQSQRYLNIFCHSKRKINNDVTIMRITNKVGELLEAHKKSKNWSETNKTADNIVVTTDGGYVQDRIDGKHNFEEMISTCYDLSKRKINEKGEATIEERLTVASAKSDKQSSIKILTKNACLRLGMKTETTITALTDGAKNCWSIINFLIPHCGSMVKVLDWFHIGKKYKEREHSVPLELRELYNRSKWHLWHGRPKTALIRLEQLLNKLEEKEAIKKVKQLLTYITNNQENIVNYRLRKKERLPYSSQLAESTVNSVINERQKNKKMQWTRKGAHHVLQIRTSIFSKTWDKDWKYIQEKMYHNAA